MIYNPRVLSVHTREQLRAELVQVGAESSIAALNEQIERATCRIVKLTGVSLTLARLLYQELVMEGGQVVTASALDHTGPGTTEVLLCGTRYQLQHLIVRLRWQPSEELQILADELEQVLDNVERTPTRGLRLGSTQFQWGARTYIMGILNVTPDSFSGDGLIHEGDTMTSYVARAVERAKQLAADGADIIDIGGESTHPHAPPVTATAELERVLPVIRALADTLTVPLSIDTYKAEVARAAVEAGATLVNDVWGLRRDPEMKRVVAATNAAVVVNHNWLDTQKEARQTGDFIGDIINHLRIQVEMAVEAGISEERILIDPGLGFGKTLEQNLELLDRLGELRTLGQPILFGPSRKGFIRNVLQVSREETAEGTAAAVALGIARGADMVRVHDVKSMARVARMTDAMVRR